MKKKKSTQWSRLDNAAKVFPAISGPADTKVFRFACELTEPVDAEVLQQALDQTLLVFPLYRSVLRHGLFWYFLEDSDIEPMVREESKRPCSPIYEQNTRRLLFDVSYYQNRLNVEIYHALTDGTGALQFLRVLVFHYLVLCHGEEFRDTPPKMDYDASLAQKMDDSFQKYYSGRKTGEKTPKAKAYHLKGHRVAEHQIKVIEGIMSAQAVVAQARSYGTTVTAMLAAILMQAIHEEMAVQDEKLPVVMSVPVNLRKYFPSQSMRNFFGLVNVGYDFKHQPGDLADIMDHVDQCFKRDLTAEQLMKRMSLMASLEHNLLARVVPLAIKDLAMKWAVRMNERQVTGSLSNLGRVKMPQVFAPYIRLFDVFVSTEKLQICMCSYEDNMVISFTSAFVSTDVQKRFFRTLTDLGIALEIVSNQVDE